VGLKNDLDQLEDLVDYYDWALSEQCFEFNECDRYSVFTDKDKAVFGVEYAGRFRRYCAKARKAKLSWMHKKLDLGVYRQACRQTPL
jgi:Glycoside-hydrolase family GH114